MSGFLHRLAVASFSLLLCACQHQNRAQSPWVNSLGMALVPLPDAAPNLLMATLETQASAMAIFRAVPLETGSGNLPCPEVSWTEARAFCHWLTKREQASGHITAHQRYRLPTDHEWSCAVGLGRIEDPDLGPEQKSDRIPNHHPWGNQWPPPKGAGNLCGRESSRQFPLNHIAHYHDALPPGKLRSAASTANALGLHDLSGSLWEWCEDRFRSGTDWRVLRGGSWKSSQQVTLLSSHRTHDPEDYRSDSVGFRCVLETGPVRLSSEKDSSL